MLREPKYQHSGLATTSPLSNPNKAIDALNIDFKSLPLGRETARGGAVFVAAQSARFACQLVSAGILSRLLAPEDFGIMAMVASVVAILGPLRDTGITNSLIAVKYVTTPVLNSLFLFTVFLGAGLLMAASLLGCCLYLFIPSPQVVVVAFWNGVAMLLGALELVPYALMKRTLDFKRMAMRDLFSLATGIITAITMAFAGCGYLALIGMLVAPMLTGLVLSWQAVAWRPSRQFASWADLKQHARFAFAMTTVELASYVTTNIDTLAVSAGGLENAGFYSRAQALTVVPAAQLTTPLGAIIFPVLAKLGDDHVRFSRWTKTLFEVLCAISIPLACGLWAISSEAVEVVLGPQWAASAPIFKWLALTVAVRPLGALAYWVIMAAHATRSLLTWGLLNAIITSASVLAAAYSGAEGIAIALSLTSLFVKTPLVLFIGTNAKGLSLSTLIMPYMIHMAILPLGLVGADLIVEWLRRNDAPPLVRIISILFCCITWACGTVMLNSNSRTMVINAIAKGLRSQ
jgi:PST family polysaccharide transporter